MNTQAARELLLSIYVTALQAVSGEQCVLHYLQRNPINRSCYLVAIGKAAAAMANGACKALGEDVRRGVVITRHGHANNIARPAKLQIIEAGHPLPDEQSLEAGQLLLEFISSTPDDAQLLFLISGGASALVELLPEEVDIAQLQQLNEWLLASGLPIDSINRVRKSVSRIKAGRLANHLGNRSCLSLMISDVPQDRPAVIGSGLLVPHSEDELSLDGINFPPWIREILAQRPPLAEWMAFRNIHGVLLATNRTARQAAAEAARKQGLKIHLRDENYQGDAVELGVAYAREVIRSEPGITIRGGESTVKLPPELGRGGRNQQLALAAAIELSGHNDCLLLAAGTDGSDGPTEDAGALVDGSTVARGELDGLDAAQCLLEADAGSFLEASGDLIQTGPTGTNVMDLVLGFKSE